jgi:hypothetical protein
MDSQIDHLKEWEELNLNLSASAKPGRATETTANAKPTERKTEIRTPQPEQRTRKVGGSDSARSRQAATEANMRPR